MGSGLADNVTQGLAQGDMFRTTPLWGIGQRPFFLHDGASQGAPAPAILNSCAASSS